MDGPDEVGVTQKLRALSRLRQALSNLITGNVRVAEDTNASTAMRPLLGEQQEFGGEQGSLAAARHCIEVTRAVLQQSAATLRVIEVQVLGERRQFVQVFW